MAVLNGDSGNNNIIGCIENDYIEGKKGNDWLDGKGGADIYKYNLGDGYDTIVNSDAYDKLLFGEGITKKNLLFIKDGNDLVIKVNHCKGKITVKEAFLFSADHHGSIMFADGSKLTAPEIAGMISATKLIYGSNVPETIYGTAENDYIDSLDGKDKIYGKEGNDIIHSCKKDDTLDGGPGADFLQGCGGNDTYMLDNFGDIVDEKPNSGIDTVKSIVDHTLAANVEYLYLTGTALKGFGNEENNNIYGNKYNNFLHGMQGDDVIYAKDGNDTVIGCYGNDKIYGGKGADSMIGNDGNDRYTVDNAGDEVIEAANEGYDSVYASINHTLADNIEKFSLTGNAVKGVGNSLDNLMYGNTQNNYLNGGGGNDKIFDYAGDDTIHGCRGNDVIYDYGGSDVFEFCEYSGRDAIYNKNKNLTDFDTIRLSGNINKNQVAFFEDGSDLMLRYNPGQEIRVKYYNLPGRNIDKVEIAQDGSYLTDADINSIVSDLAMYQADNGKEFNSAEEVANDPDAMNLIAAYW